MLSNNPEQSPIQVLTELSIAWLLWPYKNWGAFFKHPGLWLISNWAQTYEIKFVLHSRLAFAKNVKKRASGISHLISRCCARMSTVSWRSLFVRSFVQLLFFIHLWINECNLYVGNSTARKARLVAFRTHARTLQIEMNEDFCECKKRNGDLGKWRWERNH